MGKQNYIQSVMNTTQRRSKEELNADLGKLKKLNNLWGPFSFVLSPIFETMNPETLNLKQYNKKTSKKDLKIEIDDESLQKSSSNKSLKKVSPKSSLTICEEKLIVETRDSTISFSSQIVNDDFGETFLRLLFDDDLCRDSSSISIFRSFFEVFLLYCFKFNVSAH